MEVAAFSHHVLWFKCKVLRQTCCHKVGCVSFYPYIGCTQRLCNSRIHVCILLKTALRWWDKELEASCHGIFYSHFDLPVRIIQGIYISICMW